MIFKLLPKRMEEGYVLLVNLHAKNQISLDNTRLLGHLIINEFYLNCLKRDPNKAKYNPYYLYIDECGRYITEDIGSILDEGRKFGLHLILAHQRLKQLEKIIGEDGLDAVMSGCQTKVIFGGLSYHDARMVVDNVFLGQINMQEWKDRLLLPTVTGYRRTTFRHSSRVSASTSGSTRTTSQGGSSGSGKSQSMSFSPQQTFLPGGVILANTYADYSSEVKNWMDGFSFSDSKTDMQAEGESEGLEPIMEDRPFTTYSLEEQKERAAASTVRQPTQFAIIKLPEKDPVFVKIPDVEIPYASDKRVKRFKEQSYLSTQYIKTRESIEQEIKARQEQLTQNAERYFISLKTGIPLEKVSLSKTTEEEKKEDQKTFREKPIKRKKI